MTTPWTRLSRALAALPPSEPPPEGARLGAALALLAEAGDGDLELLLTRRRDDLQHHPGQVSFPGGRVEPGETVEAAALREAQEECGVDPSTVAVLGVLPATYISPSRFWLHVVVARWRRPHPLQAAEDEVAEILRVRLSRLCEPQRWRVVRRLPRSYSWAWELDGDHVLWGVTGGVTAGLLSVIDENWHGGCDPEDLPPAQEIEPWMQPAAEVPRPGPARISGVPAMPLALARGHTGAPAASQPEGKAGEALSAAAAAAAAADAVTGLLPPHGRVLLLAGPGRTGALGLELAAQLRGRAVDVRVVLASARGHADGDAARAALEGRVEVFGGTLPQADLVVDALLGRGSRGPLRPPVREVVGALRGHPVPVVSLDLPSGLDPADGLVGEAIAADVTLSLVSLPDGLLYPGLAPFVGDLYLLGVPAAGRAAITRVVRGTDEDRVSA